MVGIVTLVSVMTPGRYMPNSKPISAPIPPICLALGCDVSATFQSYKPMDTAQLRAICKVLVEKQRDVIIGFQTIGNQNKQPMVRCRLEALPIVDQRASLSQKAAQNTIRTQVKLLNQRKVNQFIQNCAVLLRHKNQSYTDLNGYIQKAVTLLTEPQYQGGTKLMFIQSDGIQDTPESRDLVCEIPSSIKFYTCNWPNPTPCKKVHGSFDSTLGFVEFLKSL